MDIDLKQAILECLADFFDQRYDGGEIPEWADVMAEAYCIDDGITNWPDVWAHMDKEIVEYEKEHEEAHNG